MTTDQALALVLDTLEAARVRYMIVGSWASGVHGQARATHDIDLVVRVGEEGLRPFLEQLGAGFYVPAGAANTLASGRAVNVIHMETAFKADLIPVRDRAFSRGELARRVAVELLGKPRWFASPEDTVLAKLEWAGLGGGERHIEDAIGVARVQGTALDWSYLHRWGRALGVQELLQRVEAALAP